MNKTSEITYDYSLPERCVEELRNAERAFIGKLNEAYGEFEGIKNSVLDKLGQK